MRQIANATTRADKLADTILSASVRFSKGRHWRPALFALFALLVYKLRARRIFSARPFSILACTYAPAPTPVFLCVSVATYLVNFVMAYRLNRGAQLMVVCPTLSLIHVV